jgi:hypothetical protein
LSQWSGNETRFATTGDDHKVVIWDVHGNVIFSMSDHMARVGFLWELTGKRLATWSEDRLLIVWNASTGEMISRIPTLCSPDRVHLDPSGDFFCLAEYWRARIVGVDGFERLRLKWQFAPITAVRRLRRSGRWLTQSRGGEMKLWSSRGKLQARIQHPFSLEDGYFEFRDRGEELLIIDDAHCLELFSREGFRVGARDKDEALGKDLRRFLRSRMTARDAITVRASYKNFEHRINPLSAPVPNSASTSLVHFDDALDEGRKVFLHFFERPDLRAIRTWLRDEVEAAVQARESVEAALHEDRTLASKLRFLQGFVLAVGGAAVLQLSRRHGDAQFALVLIAAAALVTLMWAQLRVFAMDAAERVLVALPQATDRLASHIRSHRRRIIAGIPAARVQAVYAGEEILRQIRDTIAGELSQIALRECAVLSNDLLNEDGSPIAISDWTALRLGEGAPRNQLRNLNSFWWSHSGHFVFAVHTVQFVLLTDRKIDIFTVDYDFIAQRAYDATTLTLYYGEVTEVLKRRVSRPFTLEGVSVTVDAIEVVLELRSGGSVAISMLEAGAFALRDAVRKQAAAFFADQERNLTTDDVTRPRNLDYSQDAWTNERNFLQAELKALDAASVPDTPSPLDDLIACIKRQISKHKELPAA